MTKTKSLKKIPVVWLSVNIPDVGRLDIGGSKILSMHKQTTQREIRQILSQNTDLKVSRPSRVLNTTEVPKIYEQDVETNCREEILQVIEPHLNMPEEENEGTIAPLFIMFPQLNNSPLIPSIQNRTASTSELTRHLVAAGAKADFSLMKPASRLIPPRKVVQTFDEEQAVAITEANFAISCSSVIANLAYIKSNFGNFLGTITVLEERDLPLVKAVKIMQGIEENLNQASGSVGTAIVDKFNRVLQRNPGWKYNFSSPPSPSPTLRLIQPQLKSMHAPNC
uniref:Uncharacterized protein n=1 Tax=Timema cristinae TaxID=61476 RepID=A0A7R9GQ05_TIMCR|nr:unnamed protein product [Timema cristinae]